MKRYIRAHETYFDIVVDLMRRVFLLFFNPGLKPGATRISPRRGGKQRLKVSLKVECYYPPCSRRFVIGVHFDRIDLFSAKG